MYNQLLTEQEVAEHLGLPKSQIRRLRLEKKIPHLALGYRTIKYDLNAVTAAMKRLEVRPIQ
jgi:excisionase family DNA binding protein